MELVLASGFEILQILFLSEAAASAKPFLLQIKIEESENLSQTMTISLGSRVVNNVCRPDPLRKMQLHYKSD